MSDTKFMKMAIQLAQKGRGYVNPNPMVGAVLAKDKKIVGKGFHRMFGRNHAEVNAIASAGKKARGSIMYVNLEPCSHFGKTPPCTKEIIKAGVKKVVAAAIDPNPLNKGKGLMELRENGIKTEKGLMQKEAEILNEKFFTYHKKKRPFVSIKCAMTLDGKIATVTGASKWISSKKSRDYGHLLRHEHDAVMVGVNTIKKDDPELTARFNKKMRKPCIIVADSRLSIPYNARVVKNSKENKLIVAATKKSSLKKKRDLLAHGVEILEVQSKNGHVHISQLLKKLAQKGITSILVEGGGELIYSFLAEKLADKIYFFYAPRILGGSSAPTSVEGKGIRDINKAIRLRNISYSSIGEDLLLTGYPVYKA